MKIEILENKDQSAFHSELANRVAKMYGDFGVACLNRGYSYKKYNIKDGFIILMVRRGVHEMIMSVLPTLCKIDNASCAITILHLSGTVRGCLKHLKNHFIMETRYTIAAAKHERDLLHQS